ncbi:MAG: phosphoribosylglycinamide formyltransferase [Actinobacteria bacterium]|nr:phosphoribosylglycinamide formyltransferase [Actinomycetota bacterium]MCL5447539.1 phosphoribosylglycinamide formyltransferase [Actinomycetota bacterium]
MVSAVSRLAVLASGTGTILEAITGSGIDVAVVICDRDCRALQVARGLGIETVLLNRDDYGGYGNDFDRAGYTGALVRVLQSYDTDVVAMAGFGTVLASSAYEAYPGKILNTHPALLPAFPGWHAVEDALKAGVKVTGCTVHITTPEVDAGPILAQRAVDVLEGDTAESLHERIKEVERKLYPSAIRAFMEKAVG